MNQVFMRGLQLLFQIITFSILTTLLTSSALAHEPREHDIETGELLDTPRFTLYVPSYERAQRSSGASLMKQALRTLDQTYEELSNVLMVQPSEKVVLRFLTPKEFHRRTGAPEWTSAMYLRGEISIPVHNVEKINGAELRRAVRHEYTHAVLSEISGRKCPAWLDEGIAQLFEGEPNPLLGPALRKWSSRNKAMPLDWLDQGFLTLSDDLVPVAYAQSLFATKMLVRKSGYKGVSSYLSKLKQGVPEPLAFAQSFSQSKGSFELDLEKQLKIWAESGLRHP